MSCWIISGAQPQNASLLRSRALEFMGSGIGSVHPKDIIGAVKALLQAAETVDFKIETETALLSDVTNAWQRNTGTNRLVFTI